MYTFIPVNNYNISSLNLTYMTNHTKYQPKGSLNKRSNYIKEKHFFKLIQTN